MKIVGGTWSNWSGGVTSKPKQVVAPKDEVALAAVIRSAEGTVRAPGTGHSFTPICATDGVMIDLAAFTGLKSVDKTKMTATFAAATPLWAVGPALYQEGLGLRNMGDIDRQTLGGVVGTGTHGTGRTLGNFSSAVAGFKLVTANGDLLNCTPEENSEVFAAGRCSIGTLGVMTEITMHVRPAHKLIEKNFLLPSNELFPQLDSLVKSNRHFEFFWFPYADVCICKSLNETSDPAPEPRSAEDMYRRGELNNADSRLFETINRVLPFAPFLLKQSHRLFSQFMPGAGKVRWSHEIFPSPRPTRFNEMEYAVPYAKGPDAVREVVETIRKRKINTGFPIEYRSVAADDVWISPFQGRESATIAVHQYRTVDTTKLFSAAEEVFRRYEGRPHWGKRHTRTSRDLPAVYPEFGRFQALRRHLDPAGKFLNSHLRGIFE
ncbi:MAG: D-arabinono-1,4-lactone oxidase [Rhizomicrobium sp.]